MTVFSLICYRPDCDDYCRGCYMGGSGSEFELVTSTDRGDIVRTWERKLYADYEARNDRAIAGWEVTLLIDGREPHGYYENDPNDVVEPLRSEQDNDLVEAIQAEASAALSAHIARDEEKVRLVAEEVSRKAEVKRQEALVEKDRLDRDQYLRLKEKYGDLT